MQNQSPSPSPSLVPKENKTLYVLLATTVFSLIFVLFLHSASSIHSHRSSSPAAAIDPALFPSRLVHQALFLNAGSSPDPPPPSIAYLISGRDSRRILRLLFAVYHPRNVYLLHLDLPAPQPDRDHLALTVQSVPIFRAADNVNVVGRANFAYAKGSSPISSMLHGASVLLKLSSAWDWFVKLSDSDYPLVTQDDLLHILSFVPRDVNFVNHTSHIGGRESRRLKPIIVDPGLYLSEESEMFYGTQKRDLPNAYRLYTGSSSGVLSRKFIEFCILGPDNLPRTLLMYLSNALSALPKYFPTILCNSPQFNSTIINHSLQYTCFNSKEPRALKSSDFDKMINSGAAFASPFLADDEVLDRLDREILERSPGQAVPGGWCLGEANASCASWGNAGVLRPGEGATRLEGLLAQLLSNGTYESHRCIS